MDQNPRVFNVRSECARETAQKKQLKTFVLPKMNSAGLAPASNLLTFIVHRMVRWRPPLREGAVRKTVRSTLELRIRKRYGCRGPLNPRTALEPEFVGPTDPP
jgi:hypothetical protein